MGKKISVIIPTLNAEKELPSLLQKLHNQNVKIDEIIVVDSASDDGTIEICKRDSAIKVIKIERKMFDHGHTRDLALRESIGDIVVFLTQDALPVNEFFLENLISPLSDCKVAVSTGRQLPKSTASEMEKLIRLFNYPDESHIRSKADISKMGIKTFFCSDVCAAYNRETYFKIGGFEYPIKTNEDMFFAAKAIQKGYYVAYAAEAMVFHSHNFSLREQYKRNYIQGYEIEKHRYLLGDVSQESEGKRLVVFVSKRLISKGKMISFFRFGFDCLARLSGSKAGRRAYLKSLK